MTGRSTKEPQIETKPTPPGLEEPCRFQTVHGSFHFCRCRSCQWALLLSGLALGASLTTLLLELHK